MKREKRSHNTIGTFQLDGLFVGEEKRYETAQLGNCRKYSIEPTVSFYIRVAPPSLVCI